MPARRDHREPLDLNELADVSLRKNIFRELGRDLSYDIKNGFSTDTPGAIARLMEKAFKAGMELGADPSFSATQKTARRVMTEMDIPSLPRQQIYLIRLALGMNLDGRGRRSYGPTPPESLVLIMRPKHPGMPSTISRDEWLLPFGVREEGMSNKVVKPLIKLGLYTAPHDLSGGWKVTFMTEWGFELLTTGQTRGLDDRVPGASSTVATFEDLLGDDLNDLFRRAGRTLGVIKEEARETPTPRTPRRGF